MRLALSGKTASGGALCTSHTISSTRNIVLARRRYISVAAGPVNEDLSKASVENVGGSNLTEASVASLTVWALSALPAAAVDLPAGGPPAGSYYVPLGLFVMTLPGLWSLIKRAPKAKIKRKTFEVPGPSAKETMPIDERAKQIFTYFKNYNYNVKSTGEVITFEGNYKASISQASALVAYTFISLASTALVLSIAAPWGGNWWYSMCLISPAAGAYYLKNANRTEEFKVKMVTADDDSTTDIVVEGDEEEIDRFRRELFLVEKGMEYVKGILER
ncbi:hypothetical protein Ndes2526B_g03769 [Nannochloris sp. 'desiccata']|nr:hypothetical protein KSW81_005370 [Chlorella desiccata (nom. nud.)]KAH7621420.1 putative Protein COFACTOR ASSEMBLY OF COMPLEX C SUBUNIT B CCB1, chloroplastic [Chlorella desiccata (nom. nud.)]